MEIACPACGKTADLRTTVACPRCSCDLASLATILEGALWQLRAAADRLRARDWAAALDHAEQSWSLHRSPRAARIGCLAAIALGETKATAHWRRRAQN